MPGYRVYILNEEGRIIGRHDLDCVDDTAATVMVERQFPHPHMELWQLDRLVKVFGKPKR